MVKVWNEEAVTPNNLSNHLIVAGYPIRIMDDGTIVLHNQSGIPYRVSILDYDKCIRIGAWFDLDNAMPHASMMQLESMVNSEAHMATASLTHDRTLAVWYAMSYHHGMVADHLTIMVKRFGSILQRIVDRYDDGHIIVPAAGSA
jgi:hypothetical protein